MYYLWLQTMKAKLLHVTYFPILIHYYPRQQDYKSTLIHYIKHIPFLYSTNINTKHIASYRLFLLIINTFLDFYKCFTLMFYYTLFKHPSTGCPCKNMSALAISLPYREASNKCQLNQWWYSEMFNVMQQTTTSQPLSRRLTQKREKTIDIRILQIYSWILY